ncbi:unnamed protein product [Sphagnum jensenii]|uniref:EGF-like domain-containing protein n=1 Tax=Sphagnum jensenii TaxID=128206 RepID=A0ABP1BMJ1_9BRYO
MWRRLRATCKGPTGGGWQAVGLGAVVCGLVLHITFVPFSSTLQSLQNLKLAANLNLIGLAAEDHYLAACQRMNQGAVVFQNASWKAEVGCWLNQCHAHTSSFPVPEVLGGKSCDQGCKERGVCNEELGHCRCFLGFSGAACEELQTLECNDRVSKEEPFGIWRVSRCASFCDKSRSWCLCGNGTRYPQRQVSEACGFVIKDGLEDLTKLDNDNVYGNASYKGWCNLDAEDVYEAKVPLKTPYCDCRYDGVVGSLCEQPTECSCINQCSNNGFCQNGFCACNKGWYGVDCSVPSSLPSPRHCPRWLRPSTLNITTENVEDDMVTAVVEKKRPLIYIYDLPPEFNAHMLQGRHFKFHCVNRVYDANNHTFWSDQLYGAEIALYESLLASEHRTTNGNEADFFYVPVLSACAITQADAAPHMDIQREYMGLRQYYAGDFNKRAYMHIRDNFPFWNRTSGHDHIWFFSWDEGACAAPKEIWNSTILVHWGNTNSKHKGSTTAYLADNWNDIPKEWRGDHPCYDPLKDIVLPSWKVPDPYPILEKFWARPQEERPTLFYFNGNLGEAYGGRPEATYSMGIRQKLASEFGSKPNKAGKLGRQATQDVLVLAERTPDYRLDLSKSRFCGVFPGDGWSGRLEDSVLHGCIPVIIQDGIHLPFENVLHYDSFSVRIAEEKLPNLVSILQAINDTEVDAKLAAVRGMWQRFTYHQAIKQEAERQKQQYNYTEEWATYYSSLTDDDAFSTLIQVLHYKLHNDKWRIEQKKDNKHFGIPDTCRMQRL